MSVLPDIDRSLPEQKDERPAKVTGTPVQTDDGERAASTKEKRSGEPPRVRTRISGVMARPPAPKPTTESAVDEDMEDEMFSHSRASRAPILSELKPEHLAPLAGFFMVAFFFFISLSIWPDGERNALMAYIVLGSLLGACGSWFWLKADRLDRVQANFLAAILGGMALVVLYLGAREFESDVWRIFVAVLLATLATICFLLAGVVKSL